MAQTRRHDAEQGWAILDAAHRALETQNMTSHEAIERLDVLLRTARSWGLRNVALFLDLEINHRRLTMKTARRLCGWRQP